ncbi:hypothetical protein [Alteromonas oceanisediminis]|uniref:hypothetical protein n=1 Tax=Alteromonas oceanisediminis TaxID=2836180 RepID=UPI001BD98C2B|nr:hypothetical protein [Alteromonas oceanisediminis]MBT0585050.1 hypothetical protein [Alteromonas oceanisediminis]
MLNPANLKHAFSASQYVQATQDILLPEKLTTRAQWIIGRSQCLYRTFERSELPNKNGESALHLKIKRWAPFATVGFHAVWTEHCVSVWAWDQDKANKNIEEVGVQPISVLPESVYYAKFSETRARWLASVDSGNIFQLWVAGILVVEKWFLKRPSAARFDLFLRSLALPSSLKMEWSRLQQICQTPNEAEQLDLLPTPWGAKNKTWSIVQKLPWEHNLLLIIGFGILTAYIWIFSASIAATRSLDIVEKRTAKLTEGVESVLDARSTAELLNNQTNSLLLLIDYPSQTAMMVDVSAVLMPFNLTLNGWDFKGATLEVITQGNVNTLDVVRDFETLKWIESASVSSLREPSQNRFVLTLTSPE